MLQTDKKRNVKYLCWKSSAAYIKTCLDLILTYKKRISLGKDIYVLKEICSETA